MSSFKKLKRAQSFQIMRWLDAHWDQCKSLTRIQAAERLTKELELEKLSISSDLVYRVLPQLLKDMGREWPGMANRMPVTEQGKRYQHYRRHMAKAILMLDLAVTNLYGQLNEHRPKDSELLDSIRQTLDFLAKD